MEQKNNGLKKGDYFLMEWQLWLLPFYYLVNCFGTSNDSLQLGKQDK